MVITLNTSTWFLELWNKKRGAVQLPVPRIEALALPDKSKRATQKPHVSVYIHPLNNKRKIV